MKKSFSILSSNPISSNLGLLVLRLFFGGAMLSHGWPKFQKLLEGNFEFGDPVGFGAPASLILTVFAEFFCSILLILGLASRLAVIPLIITMGVAFFVVHGADDFKTKELAFLFLGAFVGLFLTGPGRYSIDSFFIKKKRKY